MKVELREMMVYQAPPELGGLWTDVSEMMEAMGGQQKILLTRKIREDERRIVRRRQKFKMYMTELSYGGVAFVLVITMIILMTWVSYDRRQRWPDLEPAILAQKREERRRQHLLELKEFEEQQAASDRAFNQREQNFIKTQRANEETQNEDKSVE
jgi:hypothetical protein